MKLEYSQAINLNEEWEARLDLDAVAKRKDQSKAFPERRILISSLKNQTFFECSSILH